MTDFFFCSALSTPVKERKQSFRIDLISLSAAMDSLENLENEFEKMRGRMKSQINGNEASNGALQINAPAVGRLNHQEIGTRIGTRIEGKTIK
jgi:hypothetical protein